MRTLVVAVAVVLLSSHAIAQPADDSNAAVRLVRDIATDYKNFVSLDSAQTLGIGGFAALAVHSADQEISNWVVDSNPQKLQGGYEYGRQVVQLPIAVAWWAIGAAAHSERGAAAGRDLVRAQISVVSWTYAIKFATGRTRPDGSDERSFPSGHASNTFATAMVLQTHYGWKLGVPAFAVAAYTGLSRVYANEHWASDVVFGAAVGIASARTATVRLRDKKVSITPTATRGGGGVLFTVLGES